MKNNILKAHLALLIANIIYGVNHLIAKGIMPDKIGASAFIFLRVLIAGILFWFIKSFIKEKINKKDFKLLAFCGLLGVGANQLLFFHGLSLTSPIDSSIIITAIPIVTLIFSAIIVKEKITLTKFIGIFIGAIGAILLVVYGKKSAGTSSLLGNLFIFLNACSYGLYLVVVKPLMQKYNPVTVISWVFLFGFIFVLPFGIPDVIKTDFSAFTSHTFYAISFVILGTTFLTYLFNIYALQHVPSSIAGSYVYVQPVVSFIMVIIFAYFLGDKQYAQDIHWIKVFSCILVFFGVYLVSKKDKKILLN